MKKVSFPRLAGRLQKVGRRFFMVVSGALMAVSVAHGEIVASFADGGSGENPVSNQYDAWPGAAGGGWKGGWGLRYNGGSGDHSIAVQKGGRGWQGAHLKITPAPTRPHWSVYREYDLSTLDSDVITISFNISVDDLKAFKTTASNRIFIGENGGSSPNITSSTTWFLAAFGGTNPQSGSGVDGGLQAQWNVGSKDRYFGTGVLLRENKVYSFTITLNHTKRTYTVAISDGGKRYVSGQLEFHSDQPLGRTIVFAQQVAEGQVAGISIGNLVISPVSKTKTSLSTHSTAGRTLAGVLF